MSKQLLDRRVEAVVVSWNSGHHVSECVSSLARSLRLEQIHVVDNASVDGSVLNLPRGLDVLQLSTNQGFGRAVNHALQRVNSDLLLVLNPDTRFGPDALQAMEECFGDKTVAAVQPLLLLPDGRVDSAGSFLTWSGFLAHRAHHARAAPSSSPDPQDIFAAKGAALMMRVDVVRAVGGFDPSFFLYFEDSDLSWRLQLSGYRVVLCPAARVTHVSGHAVAHRDSAELDYHSFRNRLSSLIKNLSTPRLLVILPIHIAVCLGIAFIYVVTGRPRHSLAVLRALKWNIRNLPMLLSARSRVQVRRRTSDRSLFRLSYSRGIYFGPGVGFVRAYFRTR